PRGKEPLTPNGFHDASTDLATIRDWWQRWPEANVAIVTGRRSGFWVLDVDDDEALAELLSRHGALPDTAESLTGGGGRHVLFAWPADGLTITNARGRLPDGLDVRGEGGYIVGPPSVHPSGRAYAWEVSSDPLDGAAIVPAPDWLLELIAGPRPRPQGGGPLPDTIPEGHRNTALTSLAGSMRRRGASEDAIYAALQAENLARCDPPLGHEEVRTIARSVARYEPATFQTTRDYAHAETLAVLFANRLRWAERWGRWMRWTGKVWEQAPEEWVVRAASEALRAEYARHIAAAGDKEELGHWSALAAQTCVYARVAGGLAFLKGWPGFLTRPAQWDGDRWVLNTQSGILDLRSLELRPHDPAALCTKITGAAYDPGAEGSTWMAHLQRVLPNDNVRRQVQRSLGVALVGTTVEEALDIWHGSGRNGKTTTARALMAALGDYARPAAPNLLIQSKYERHPTELADLAGLRLTFSIEVDRG
ncbi:MAG: bifunctional DNA primase/polymerase, partial [Anaerolineae bacterium]|nr:bifunctional DNA primase/polymerase [Anaerolineae bacterium]